MKGKRLLLPIVLMAAVGGGLWYGLGRTPQAADKLFSSGTVEATEAQLGFLTAGRLAFIGFREGDAVDVGTELARLDITETVARRGQSLAQVAVARAHLAELESGSRPEEISQARAAVDAARQRVADAERDWDRTQLLFAGGAVSREAYDKAELSLDLTRSLRVQAEEQLQLLVAGPRRERIEAQRAQLAQAEAVVETVDAMLTNMTILAPISGLVTVRHREPGEIVAPGTPVLTLLDLEDRWVRIYVPEARIGAVGIGDRAEILSDTYPQKRYAGEVIFIASKAEFTPKTVQTQEERVRLVYAVKVRIVEDPRYELKPGMPVDAVLSLAPPSDASHTQSTSGPADG
jgi:HlyD family secretion protein